MFLIKLLPTKVVTRSGTLSVPDPIYCVWCVGGAERVGGRGERGRKKNDGFLFSPFVCLFVRFLQCFFPTFCLTRTLFLKLRVRDSPIAKNEVSGY